MYIYTEQKEMRTSERKREIFTYKKVIRKLKFIKNKSLPLLELVGEL